MKTIIALLLSCLMLTACGITQEATVPSEPPETTATVPAAAETEEIPTEAQPISLTLYIPNENADGFIENIIEVESVNDSILIEKLIEFGALPEGIAINTFEAADQTLYIDFNADFRDHLLTQGSAGESMLIGTVVNTFLNAYGAESLMLTVDGQVMESGHVVYDFPLTVTQ